MILSFPIFAEDLRYHPSVWHRGTGVSHPAMIAAMRDVQGVVQAVHRTYLTPDGRKLSGEGIEAKKMLGSSHGCAIRLAPVSDKIALTEGIENALSVMQLYGWPCWATGIHVECRNISGRSLWVGNFSTQEKKFKVFAEAN